MHDEVDTILSEDYSDDTEDRLDDAQSLLLGIGEGIRTTSSMAPVGTKTISSSGAFRSSIALCAGASLPTRACTALLLLM